MHLNATHSLVVDADNSEEAKNVAHDTIDVDNVDFDIEITEVTET
jgi:hypothetical protein